MARQRRQRADERKADGNRDSDRDDGSTHDGDLPELVALGWQAYDARIASTSFRVMVWRLPALAARALGVAWQASRADTAAACGLQVVSGVLTAFGLLATRGVLEALFAGGPTPERVRAAAPAVALVGAAATMRGALQAGAGWTQARLGPRVNQVVEIRLYEATTSVGLAAFDNPTFFAALQRATDRGTRAASEVVDATIDTVTATVGLVAVGGTLALLHPALLPLLVVSAVPRGWAAVRAARMQYVSIYRRTMIRRRKWILSDLMTDRFTAADLRAYTMRAFLLRQYANVTGRDVRAELSLTRRQAVTRVVGNCLSGLAAALVYVSLGVLLATGHLPLAVAGTAVLAIQSGQLSLGNLVLAVNRLYEEGMYFTDYLAFLRDAAARTPAPGRPAPADFATISVEGVSFRYPGAERDALHEVSMTIRAGQIVALVGENGSGKTTLAKLVAGLYEPDGGRIRWDDTDLAGVGREELAARITVVTQDYARWPFTAGQNISLGAPGQTPEAVVAAARSAGADTVVERLPHGYDTLLDRTFVSGVDLSGGQWQRLAIARGFYRHAPLLICDEPAAALDARVERSLYDALRELAADRTVLLITHRLSSVRDADYVYVLHEGRVEEAGTHDELIAAGGRYAELYGMQAAAYQHPPGPTLAPSPATAG